MNKRVRDQIVRDYYDSRTRYEKLSIEVRRLFDEEIDPRVPPGSIYTMTHRIKDPDRLIEKIEGLRGQVGPESYKKRIKDILGLRIVCLRRSDVDAITEFIQSLEAEEKLKFVEPPKRKETFLLPIVPGEVPAEVDLQYSGYASVHCVARLGKAVNSSKDLASLIFELQVRTILEEAWGEIDHKYHYEVVRVGNDLPDSLRKGFYDFSAYLQAAALHAEHLCEQVDELLETSRAGSGRGNRKAARKKGVAKRAVRKSTGRRASVKKDKTTKRPTERVPATLEEAVERTIGVSPSDRTIAYMRRRLSEHHRPQEDLRFVYQELLSPRIVEDFKRVYREILNEEPFVDAADREIDLVNIFNYALFLTSSTQEPDVTVARLRSVLSNRLVRG